MCYELVCGPDGVTWYPMSLFADCLGDAVRTALVEAGARSSAGAGEWLGVLDHEAERVVWRLAPTSGRGAPVGGRRAP